MSIDLQSRIEQVYLESQKQLVEGLDGVPTPDQLLMGILTEIPRPLSFAEVDYYVRSMIIRLNQLQHQPAILYYNAFERFSKFVLEYCSVEEKVITMQRISAFEVKCMENVAFDEISEIVEEFSPKE